MSAGSKPKRARAAQDRMQVRCSVDKEMEDLYDWLSGMAPGKRGRELLAAARVGRALKDLGGSLAALIAAAGLRTSNIAAMAPGDTVAAAGAAPVTDVGSASLPTGGVDLSMAAAQGAASAFGADFFSAAPVLQ